MIIFRKARSARQTKNDLDAYLKTVGDEPVRWLAREVQSWGEFSYAELENLIMSGGLNDLIDWQARWADVINQQLAAQWQAAMAAAAKKATKGKIILDDSDIDVKNFLRTRGGELITVLSEESKKAVAMVILRGQAEKVLPKKIAQQIRPLIGLNQRQAQANMTYRQRVYQNLLASGLPPVTAEARAAKAALRYAGKQHRERADMIVNTELAFAYNRGADIGIKRAIKGGYMGRCEMVWTTAGTNRVCPRCLALKDKVVGHTDEDGVTLPPLHPRCRCAIMYREVEKPEAAKPKSPIGDRNYNSELAKTIGKEHYDKARDLVERTAHTQAAQVWGKFEKELSVKLHDESLNYHSWGTLYLNIERIAEGDGLKPYQVLFHEAGHFIDWTWKVNSNVEGNQYISESYKNGAFLKAINKDIKALIDSKSAQIEASRLARQAEIQSLIDARDWQKLYREGLLSKVDYEALDSRYTTSAKRKKIIENVLSVKVSKDEAFKAVVKEIEAQTRSITHADLSDIFDGYSGGKVNMCFGHGKKYWKERGNHARATEAFAEFFDSAITNPESYALLKQTLPTAEKVFNEMLDELLKVALT